MHTFVNNDVWLISVVSFIYMRESEFFGAASYSICLYSTDEKNKVDNACLCIHECYDKIHKNKVLIQLQIY